MLGGVTDQDRAEGEHEVIELMAAARRLRSQAEWMEAQATAEFAARRWDAGPAKGPERRPDGRMEFKGRAAEFAAEEIAFRLTEDQCAVQDNMELSLALRDRLPRMDACLKAGEADLHRCRIVSQEPAPCRMRTPGWPMRCWPRTPAG